MQGCANHRGFRAVSQTFYWNWLVNTSCWAKWTWYLNKVQYPFKNWRTSKGHIPVSFIHRIPDLSTELREDSEMLKWFQTQGNLLELKTGSRTERRFWSEAVQSGWGRYRRPVLLLQLLELSCCHSNSSRHHQQSQHGPRHSPGALTLHREREDAHIPALTYADMH